MPNHITNILRAHPEVLDSLLRDQTTEEMEESAKYGETNDGGKVVDFSLLIELPADDDPRITATKTEYPGGMVGWSVDGISPMDFARSMWGTKWNAYSQQLDDRANRIQFDTAWTHPAPVVETLSKLHPDKPITVMYADEDFGYNLGHYVMLNGEIVNTLVSDDSDEDDRNEFAARVLYGTNYATVKEEWGEK